MHAQATRSLALRGHPLAEPSGQLRLLAGDGGRPGFAATLAARGLGPLRAGRVGVLQVNVGRVCNQTCRHCHVDAGPDRREAMSRATMQDCLDALVRGRIPTLDVTGGAPEMNPNFRWLVAEARALGVRVIDRCNLTILVAPGYTDLPEFLAGHGVEVVASLPCYTPGNTDAQRGGGVFDRSIAALRRLNAVGYARPGTGLTLNLVYNPLGPSLPPDQDALGRDYKRELLENYGVAFDRLYALTNLPVSRFLEDLADSGRLDQYMELLVNAFNPAAVAGLMCRETLSVHWDGGLHDCDFNQMLDLPLSPGQPRHVRDFDPAALTGRPITTADHCYGCTAGAGSSCGGTVT